MAKWEPIANRFVAFIDIMGFRDIINKKPTEDVLKVMKKFHLTKNTITTMSAEFLKRMNKSSNKMDYDLIRMITFSDSLLIASKNDSQLDTFILIKSCIGIINHCFILGIPIKGAISHGEMYLNDTKEPDSIYFGKPFLDSYDLQNKIKFYGVVLHDTAEKVIEKRHIDKLLKDTSLIHNYRVPSYTDKKQYYHKNHYCLNWSMNLPDSIKPAELFQKFSPTITGGPQDYFDNTMEFINKMPKVTN